MNVKVLSGTEIRERLLNVVISCCGFLRFVFDGHSGHMWCLVCKFPFILVFSVVSFSMSAVSFSISAFIFLWLHGSTIRFLLDTHISRTQCHSSSWRTIARGRHKQRCQSNVFLGATFYRKTLQPYGRTSVISAALWATSLLKGTVGPQEVS